MTTQNRWNIIYQLLLPAVGVGLAYAIFVGRPLQQQVSVVRAQIQKTTTSAQLESPVEQLVAARQLEQQLQSELARLQTSNQHLTAQPDKPGDSAVAKMADVLALFKRCHLKCIESGPVAEETASSNTKVKLRLTGTFQQMRQALQLIQAAPACVSLLSLSMQPCLSPDEATHQWILIILV